MLDPRRALAVAVVLLAGGCECGASHVRTDAGADAAAIDAGADAAAIDASVPDAGPPPEGVPVLVASTDPGDRLLAFSIAEDGTWVQADAHVELPGIPRRVALAPDASHALVSYVTTVDGERGVVAVTVARRPLRVTATQRLALEGPGDLAQLGFTSNDTAVVVRYVTDAQHELIALRRDPDGVWRADTPLAFPVAWPGRVHGIPTQPGRGLVVRRNERDLRDGTTIYPIDVVGAPLTISVTPTSIDAIGVLAVHPSRAITFHFVGTPRVPFDEPQTGQLTVLDETSPFSWTTRGAPFDLPNEPELAAIAPDGSHAFVLEPIVRIDRDPDTGEPIFTDLGYGLDRVALDAEGAPTGVEERVASLEADRVEELGVLADGRVLVARSIGSGPILSALVAFAPSPAGLVEQSSIEVQGLLRAAFAQ